MFFTSTFSRTFSNCASVRKVKSFSDVAPSPSGEITKPVNALSHPYLWVASRKISLTGYATAILRGCPQWFFGNQLRPCSSTLPADLARALAPPVRDAVGVCGLHHHQSITMVTARIAKAASKINFISNSLTGFATAILWGSLNGSLGTN